MSNVLEPSADKPSLTDRCAASMAVDTLINAVIPMVTINAVITDRNKFARTERRPSRIFSSKFMPAK
jgi:hypothetical protein